MARRCRTAIGPPPSSSRSLTLGTRLTSEQPDATAAVVIRVVADARGRPSGTEEQARGEQHPEHQLHPARLAQNRDQSRALRPSRTCCTGSRASRIVKSDNAAKGRLLNPATTGVTTKGSTINTT